MEEELCTLLVNDFKYVTRSREFTNNPYLKSLKKHEMSNSFGIYRFSAKKIEHFFFISTTQTHNARDTMLNHLIDLENLVTELQTKISELFIYINKYPEPEFYLSKKNNRFFI